MDRMQLIATLARAIDAATSADNAGVERSVAIVLDLARRMGAQQTLDLPGVSPAMSPRQENISTVSRLFAYWQEQCGHPTAKLTPERGKAIASRLRDGYTETEIRKAIDGAAAGAYQSDDGKRYDDITLVCRNGSKLEDFITRGVKSTGEMKTETAVNSPIEEQIAALRRKMSELLKAGRRIEYDQASAELSALMTKRKGS